MLSNNKQIYRQLSDYNKRKAIETIVEKTERSKSTIKQHWFWNDCIPKEHESLVEKILKKVLNEQEAENSRKETV